MSVQLFEDHQKRALALTRAVVAELAPGQDAEHIEELAKEHRAEHGFDRWLAPPVVLLSPRPETRTRAVHSGVRSLQPGDLITLDLSPASAEAFGRVCVTWCYQSPNDDLLDKARDITRATCGYSSRYKTVGELYIFAETWALNRQMKLARKADIGHRCLLPEGKLALGWPHTARAVMRLRRNRVQGLNPRRLEGVFTICVPVTDGKRVAAFGELIHVDGEKRTILGREGIDDVGTF